MTTRHAGCRRCPPVRDVLDAALRDAPRPLCSACDAAEVRQRELDEYVAQVTRHEAELAAEQDRLRERWADPAPSCTCGTARDLLAGHLTGAPPDCTVHRPQRPPQPNAGMALNSDALVNGLAQAVGGTVVTGSDL